MTGKKKYLACLAILLAAHGLAQAQNVFGAVVKNPGSLLPEWWNEIGYIPPTLDGARHIRMGSAGQTPDSRYGSLGRNNCDIPYLYAAKSGKPLSKAEMEECALLEFHIKKGIDGDRRNENDGFVKREIIDEMAPFINQRIELFRNTDKFYFRAFGMQVDPYDFQSAVTRFKLNWPEASTSTAQYAFRSFRLASENNRELSVPIMGQPALSRELEAARLNTGNSMLPLAMNLLVFSVEKTDEKRSSSGVTKNIHFTLHGFTFRYVDAQRNTQQIALGF